MLLLNRLSRRPAAVADGLIECECECECECEYEDFAYKDKDKPDRRTLS